MKEFRLSRYLSSILIGVMLISFVGCSKKDKSIVLATTTSTQDSGLLDYLLPEFEKESGIKVKVLAKGTGEALEIGKRGDADCLLVHAKVQEEQFIKDGYGTERYDVMYNDFIIVGPKEDPAGLKEKASNDAVEAFKLLESKQAAYISRGDESGTHTKEKNIWKAANISPSGSWYISAGKGMGAVLQMADEKKGYTITDRATYLSIRDKVGLTILTEKSKDLYNQYGVIKLNSQKSNIKEKEAEVFINWILSDKGQNLIGEYGKDKYGQSLFIPNAKK
jgi:tungstate transport system substrate-binding protein